MDSLPNWTCGLLEPDALAGQYLTGRPVAGRALQREDGAVLATNGVSRRVVEATAGQELTIAGHVRPTVPQMGRE